jgi:phosphoribosylformylglycinamidine cyclo-ligase
MSPPRKMAADYKSSGVDIDQEDKALKNMIKLFHQTYSYRKKIGSPALPIAHFAGVIKFTNRLGLVLKSDGVGTKVFVAQMMDRYNTVGIDCVAMNVNDVICVGGEPISFIDYLAIQKPDQRMLEEIAQGLVEGAKKAKVALVGGETAQLPEMIKGKRRNRGFDLAGMCLGVVPLQRIIKGDNIVRGDVVIGLESSGIHSNGLTLARRILLEEGKLSIHRHIDEVGRTLGEELLEPTRIYVSEVLEMFKADIRIKAIAHITGKGILNLGRVGKGVGYIIEKMAKPQPIFNLIQKKGKLPDDEMYRIFNMGVGLCIVLPASEAEDALAIAEKHKVRGLVMGKAVKDPQERLILKPKSLIGFRGHFQKA